MIITQDIRNEKLVGLKLWRGYKDDDFFWKGGSNLYEFYWYDQEKRIQDYDSIRRVILGNFRTGKSVIFDKRPFFFTRR